MTTSRAEVTRAIGGKGLSVWGGQVNDEYLTIFRSWSSAARVYLEMLDDTVIGTLLNALKLPLLASEFDVTPASDSPADAKARDRLWLNMNGMNRQTWRSHVTDALEAVDFGFAISEVVLEKRSDGLLWLANLEPRGQETLWRWTFDGDMPTYMVQRLPQGGTISVPLDKCLHFTFRGRKGNPQGKSLLRNLYRPWRFLKNLENFEGIGIERDVGGMPVVELDKDMYQGWTVDQLQTMFQDSMEGLRMDETMWLLMPPGSIVKPYASGAKAYDIRRVIQDKQKEILMFMFAQFLTLGMDKVGTQALVEGSQDFFSLGLLSLQQQLLETWQQQLVPFLFRFSPVPGMTGLPQITWSAPGKVDVTNLIDSYVKASNGRLITPIREDEEKVRAAMDLPDLPEGVGEEPREPQVHAPGIPGLFEGQEGHIGPGGPHKGHNGSGDAKSRDTAKNFVSDNRDTLVAGKPKEVEKLRNSYLKQQGYSKEEIARLDEMQNGWMRGVYNPNAQVMRQVAASEYGKDFATDDYHDNMPRTDKIPSERDVAVVKANRDFAVETMRAKYGDEVIVYRGVQGTQAAAISQGFAAGEDVELGVNSISSWSTSSKGAQKFAGGIDGGVVVQMTVSVESVWGAADTSTNFSLGEKEVILGSSTGRASVQPLAKKGGKR